MLDSSLIDISDLFRRYLIFACNNVISELSTWKKCPNSKIPLMQHEDSGVPYRGEHKAHEI